MIQSDFCVGCKHWPCGDIDSDTEVYDCDYFESKEEKDV